MGSHVRLIPNLRKIVKLLSGSITVEWASQPASMLSLRSAFSTVGLFGAENESAQPKKEQSWSEKYNEAIQKQMAERRKAFNENQIQKNPQELARFIAAQRERIMALEAERDQRTR